MTSAKASIANAPLTFTSFVVSHVFEAPQALGRVVATHYSSQLTKQIFGILGSLAILGAPADFITNVGTGVYVLLVRCVCTRNESALTSWKLTHVTITSLFLLPVTATFTQNGHTLFLAHTAETSFTNQPQVWCMDHGSFWRDSKAVRRAWPAESL